MRNYVIKAVLQNVNHPEYGVVTIPFPIFPAEYDRVLETLATMGIGKATERDCLVKEIDSYYAVLEKLNDAEVNIDELDYLAKRLDSLCVGEDSQFQCMAAKLNLSDVKDFINLTFCCQKATVITDFSNLEQVGKNHCMARNGGSMPADQCEKLNGKMEAIRLIQQEEGTITPYGVVYDNGMKLESLYDGKHLPIYLYDEVPAIVVLSVEGGEEDTETLYLPYLDSHMKRALERLGVSDVKDCNIGLDVLHTGYITPMVKSLFTELFDIGEHLETLNRLAKCAKNSDQKQSEIFRAIVEYTQPQTPSEVLCIAEDVAMFEAVAGIKNAEGYGHYLIEESGHFEYDSNLDDYLDFKKCGEKHMREDRGVITEWGYLAYQGTEPAVKAIMERRAAQMQEDMQGMGPAMC